MNYIDELATEIGRAADPNFAGEYLPLYRIYAVLLLAKGEGVTAKDVHDAWSAWCAQDEPEHRSLIPFDELRPDVQRLDDPYVRAIHTVAKKLNKHD